MPDAMKPVYNLLANILIAFMAAGYAVLTAGLVYWLLLSALERNTRQYGFSNRVALLDRWR